MASVRKTMVALTFSEDSEKDHGQSRLGYLSSRSSYLSCQSTCSENYFDFVSLKFNPLGSAAALLSHPVEEVLEYRLGRSDRIDRRGSGRLHVFLEYCSKVRRLPDRMQLNHIQAGCIPPIFRLQRSRFVKKYCAVGKRMYLESSSALYGLHCFSYCFVNLKCTSFFPAENCKTPKLQDTYIQVRAPFGIPLNEELGAHDQLN